MISGILQEGVEICTVKSNISPIGKQDGISTLNESILHLKDRPKNHSDIGIFWHLYFDKIKIVLFKKCSKFCKNCKLQ